MILSLKMLIITVEQTWVKFFKNRKMLHLQKPNRMPFLLKVITKRVRTTVYITRTHTSSVNQVV